jgi:hypothetical protein
MRDYIAKLIVKFDHALPSKPQHPPYKHVPIVYGATVHYASGPGNSPPLNAAGIQRVQAIVEALLYYTHTVDNKFLVTLSELGQHQAAAAEATNNAIDQLVGYLSTYPDDGITYRTSAIILSTHSDITYLNVNKARSRADVHIILSEDVPVPIYNKPVLTVAQIIKCIMSSVAETKLIGLLICAKERVPLRQSGLNRMATTQVPHPI